MFLRKLPLFLKNSKTVTLNLNRKHTILFFRFLMHSVHYYEICFLPISFKSFQNVLTWKENKQTFLIIIIILRDVFFEEIYTDSFLVIPRKNALAVALNHAWFSDGSIANDYHLQRKEKTIKVERYVRNPQYSILKYRDVVHIYIYI